MDWGMKSLDVKEKKSILNSFSMNIQKQSIGLNISWKSTSHVFVRLSLGQSLAPPSTE